MHIPPRPLKLLAMEPRLSVSLLMDSSELMPPATLDAGRTSQFDPKRNLATSILAVKWNGPVPSANFRSPNYLVCGDSHFTRP